MKSTVVGKHVGAGYICGIILVGALTFFSVRSHCWGAEEKVSASQPVQGVATTRKADESVGFGYKCAWFAVKTNDQQAVVKALGLQQAREVAWREGVEAAYKDQVFVTPVIKGWVLAASQTQWGDVGDSRHPNLIAPRLKKLSEKFGEVQYFGTHRVVEFQAWAKASKGSIQRAYAYLGESGKILWVLDEPTAQEKELSVRFLPKAGAVPVDGRRDPDEGDVMTMAGKWSVNPTELRAEDIGERAGVVGKLQKVGG